MAVAYKTILEKPRIFACIPFVVESIKSFDLGQFPTVTRNWAALFSHLRNTPDLPLRTTISQDPSSQPPWETGKTTDGLTTSVPALAIGSVELLADRRTLSIRSPGRADEIIDLVSANHTTLVRPWWDGRSPGFLHVLDAGFVADPPAQVTLNAALMLLAFTPFHPGRPVHTVRIESVSLFPEYGSIPTFAHIAPDGQALLLAYPRSRVCILDLSTKRLVDLVVDPTGSMHPHHARLVLDGELALVVHGNGPCKIEFFRRDGSRIFPVVPLEGGAWRSPSGMVAEDTSTRRIYVQSGNRVLCFDFSGPTPKRSVVPGPAHFGPFAISPDQKTIAIVGLAHSSRPSIIELWDIDPDPTFRPRRLLQSQPLKDHPRTMVFTPDGQRLLYSQFDRLEILPR